jgi:Tol biopolymer transport system component
MRRRVGGLALLVWLPVALAPTSTATTGDPVTVRVSVASNGTEGNGEGFFGPPGPSMSSDGRFVAFDSAASNLVTADTNGRADVFVHDVLTRETTRVSLASDGTEADHLSAGPRISADGRIVAFESFADNLVPGDTNGSPDVFVHNRMTGRTTRVSVASDGTQANEGVPGGISISATGRFVAFESGSSTLVPGDTNGVVDIFVRDRLTRQTTRVSVASDGAQANRESFSPSLSADGKYVAFESPASNLVARDTNRQWDIFVHDRTTGATTRVSLNSHGAQANGFSIRPAISADGRFVAFGSMASTLVPRDTNFSFDIFVHDTLTGRTTRISVASDGTQASPADIFDDPDVSISADGRFVAFDSWFDDLVPDDTNGTLDVFVHDQLTGDTTRASVASDATQGNMWSFGTWISSDGRVVAFESAADNLVPGDTNGVFDVFLRMPKSSPQRSTLTPATRSVLS